MRDTFAPEAKLQQLLDLFAENEVVEFKIAKPPCHLLELA